MPTFEYRCLNKHCDKIFERVNRKFEDASKDDACPECATRAVRIFSVPAAIIIG